jgi:hypothetical protein
MNEKLEYLLKTKAYSELTEDELREFNGLCDSREEYENMQLFFSQLDNYKSTQSYDPHYMTKGSLDEVFEKKYAKQGILVKLFPPNKPIYLSPLVQIAALIVIVFLIFQFTSTDSVNTPQIAIVEKPIVKNKPKAEEKSKASENIPKEEINHGQKVKKNPDLPRINEPQKNDNGSVFQPRNDETITATNAGSTSVSEADYSSTAISTSTTTTNFLSSAPTTSYSGTIVTTGNDSSRSRTRNQEDYVVEDTKSKDNKKSNLTIQPKLFDLLTAVY